ncbi:hypothetical protein [Virgibacillus ihumii]|uniref:hypothetical protein n=1 Tax=Virgibacillus ihumii TaxID=2686091 RepID=UPI00157DA1F0|nr:hypothetical protein [Virgibacillus ihumii]
MMSAVVVLLVILGGSFYVYYTFANAELTAENTTASVHTEDFVMHIRVEKEEKGFRVYRSLQYVGEGEVDVVHNISKELY